MRHFINAVEKLAFEMLNAYTPRFVQLCNEAREHLPPRDCLTIHRDTIKGLVGYWNREETPEAMADALHVVVGSLEEILADFDKR